MRHSHQDHPHSGTVAPLILVIGLYLLGNPVVTVATNTLPKLIQPHLGKINSAHQFDDIDDYMRFPQAIADMTEMTFWIWLNIPSGQSGLYNIFVDTDGESIAGAKIHLCQHERKVE